MADKQQLRILSRGVKEWNNWRDANSKIEPDLSGAQLRAIDLRNANLRDANFAGTDFRGALLSEPFCGVAKLARANLCEANLSGMHLVGVIFEGANLNGADLSRSNLGSAVLRLVEAINADLTLASAIEANFHGANLTSATLEFTDLTDAHLGKAIMRHADLTKTRFCRSYLEDADFEEATMGDTVFVDNDLSKVKGLRSVHHKAPSSVGIDTLYQSAGNIPDEFLIGCGVPDTLVQYHQSHIGAAEAIQFYSCFISYSHKDEGFAELLHSRLRREHIRVWFAPEDIKGGAKIHEQIDRAIQLYDRLLIVLSESSLRSEWVVTEIRKARKTEVQENRRKLFPIRLVSFDQIKNWECFDADTGKDLAVEIREYFIPDFTSWKDHDSFESGFKRLIRDLRAAER